MAIFGLLAGHPRAEAQEVTAEQILKALTPQTAPRTRGLSVGPQAAPERSGAGSDAVLIDSVRDRPSRSLSLGERDRLGAVAENKPQFDVPMEFDSNSDVLRGTALAHAEQLGRALSAPAMRGQTFMIAGHTDARGSLTSNQALSERRAEAVKQYLVKTHAIPAANLIAVGYGKTRLRSESNPTGRENRRVQAVNMLQVKTAGR